MIISANICSFYRNPCKVNAKVTEKSQKDQQTRIFFLILHPDFIDNEKNYIQQD